VVPQSFVYVKIHILTNQGVDNLTQKQAEALAGEDPDAFTRDLHDSIAQKTYPSWNVYAQVVKPADVATFPVNIYDPTKRWPTSAAPLRRFGKITLNKNVIDEFGEVEQASFTPTAIVPGWDVSADPSKPQFPVAKQPIVTSRFFFLLRSLTLPNSPPNPTLCIRLSCPIPPGHQLPPTRSQ